MSKYTIDEINAMSPEEFDKVDPNDLVDDNEAEDENASQQEEQQEDTGEGDEDNQEENPEDQNKNNQGDENEPELDEDGNPIVPETEEEEEEGQQEEENPNTPPATPDPAKAKPEGEAEAGAEEQVDYAKFHEILTSEFKANGQTFKITQPEDIKKLVQQGLNYNKKMNEIRPHLNITKVLEENGLFDVEELGFLIDLKNGNPEAIAKLIKDKNIDAYDLDEEKANSYKQTPVNIPNQQVQLLQEVVREHEGNEDFNTVFEQAKTWDSESQDQLLANPNYLAILADHKTRGVYDKVMQQVNYLQTVQGNKTPTVQLYHAVGSQMYGGEQKPTAQAQVTTPAPNAAPKTVKRVDPNLANRRRAVSSVKSKAKGNTKPALTAEDIYNMDPAEFAKMSPADFN